MPAPKISVVITTYNRALYLVAALESVFRQSIKDYEVVIIDDGSTDATAKVLQPYLDRVNYVHQENRGEAGARNRGIAEARGEWIAFLDSDDMWEPQTLETLLQAARRHPEAGLIAMKARVINADGSPTRRVVGKKSKGPFITTRSLLWGDTGAVQTPMVQRRLLEGAGGFDETLLSAPDIDMWLRLSFVTRMVGLPDLLLMVRTHGANITEDRALNARMLLRVLEKLRRDHPEFVEQNRWHYRRALGKESLRLGRELLAVCDRDPAVLPEARRRLRDSIRLFPFFLRSHVYLSWAYLAPRSYPAWRRYERGSSTGRKSEPGVGAD